VKIVSLITARGGSKGIPNKNIIDINGKPLIQYSIQASLNSKVDETWVSTDSIEIARVARKCGARIIKRNPELANDTIMPDATLVDFANKQDFDMMVFIQPTSPLIKKKYINTGIDLMDKYDSVFTVTEEHWLPRWNTKGKPINWDINNRPRRQDMDSTYVENGMMYISTKKDLLKYKLRYSGKVGYVKIPLCDSFQLDSYEDLYLLRRLL
tara:strand:+ start:204 stop:836 length:633 start_codon:yes stop_codon:yes gene_type:complete